MQNVLICNSNHSRQKGFSPQNGGSIRRVELEKQPGSLPTWTSGCTVCDASLWHLRRRETDLVGLVNVIAGQRAQKVLQAWDVVIIDGMDDGFHHKGVFLVLRDTRRERVAHWPGSSATQQVNPGLFAKGAF